MGRHVVVLLLVLFCSPGLTTAYASRIEALKPLFPETSLVAKGQASCLIVAPAAAAWQAEAAALASRIESEAHARPVVANDTAIVSAGWKIDFDTIRGRNVIALGTINNNRLIARLWGEGYTAEDDAFPGTGGFVVRTVHDPFARGINVVVLAASDVASVKLAADALLSRHADAGAGTLSIAGPVVEVKRGTRPPVYPDLPADRQPQATLNFPPPAAFAADLDRRVTAQVSEARDETAAKKPTMVNVTKVLTSLARAWFYTGDPGYPPLMKRLVDRHRALLAIVPKRAEMEAGTADDVIWWDLVEELPVWTDQDRRDLTNALLADASQGYEKNSAYELVKQGYVQTITENHGTNSALHIFDAWRYFAKYYDLPETHYWLDVVRATFNGQLASHQVLEDSAAYLSFSHRHDISYALESGDLRFFQLGIARSQMEFDLQCVYSNLGLSAGFGDSRPLRFPYGYEVVARMGWMLHDPRAAWWWRSYLPRCGVDTYSAGLPFDASQPLEEPTEFTGLRVLPIYRQALGREMNSKTFVTTPPESAGPEWFNKAVFREAWSPDAQYLMLDGAGVWRASTAGGPPGPSGHKHDDINTIITFTDKGRLWLVDHTYAARAIQDHSGLTIAHDGAFDYSPRPARLRNAAESTAFAITRSVFEGYADADWERTIFWRRGDHFVVLDRAIAKEAGDFAVRCSYRALGEARLRDGELRLAQQGRYFQIRSDGEGREMLDRHPFTDSANWRRDYTYAEPVAKILQHYKSGHLEPGHAIAFVNLLKASDNEAELDGTRLARFGEAGVVVSADGKDFIYGLGELSGQDGDCDAFALGPDNTGLMTGLRRLGPATEPLLTADAPIDLSWTSDGVTLRTSASTSVTLAGKSMRLDAGEHPLGDEKLRTQLSILARDIAQAAKMAATHYHPPAKDRALVQASLLPAQVVPLRTDIQNIVAADLDGDGQTEWVTAGNAGLSAFSADGILRWRFAPGKPCRALAAADLDGDGKAEIAVGCEDEKLYLVDGAGHARWRFACKPTELTVPPVPDQIEIADLDHDGRKEIIVAANYFHCLTPDGHVQWEDYWAYARRRRVGDALSFQIADFNRDGRDEVVAAFDFNYPVVTIYNSNGRRVYPQDEAKRYNYGVLAVHRPNAAAALDLFGDDGSEPIVVATQDQLSVRWTGGERDTRHAADIAGGVVALATVTLPGAKKPLLITASDMGSVCARQTKGGREDGEHIEFVQRWQRTLDGPISTLWSGRAGEHAIAIIGMQEGTVFALDAASGNVLGRIAGSGAPVVKIVPESDSIAVARADGSISILAISNLQSSIQ